MTNRLELNWKLDGFVDEQRYYCSETPIDPLNLPLPKAVLAGDVRMHVDTNIEVDKTYYIVVSSVKNGTEKLSVVKNVDTMVFIQQIKLPLISNAIDLVNPSWSATLSNVSFDNGLVLNGINSSAIFDVNKAASRLPETPNFELKVSFNAQSFIDAVSPILFDTQEGFGVEYQIWITTQKVCFIWYASSGNKAELLADTSLLQVQTGINYTLKIKRVGSRLDFYLNDILKNTCAIKSAPSRLVSGSKLHVGYAPNATEKRRFSGKIWGIELKVKPT